MSYYRWRSPSRRMTLSQKAAVAAAVAVVASGVSGCEVRAECLEFALATDQRFGVWDGLSERERRPLKRVRRATA